MRVRFLHVVFSGALGRLRIVVIECWTYSFSGTMTAEVTLIDTRLDMKLSKFHGKDE